MLHDVRLTYMYVYTLYVQCKLALFPGLPRLPSPCAEGLGTRLNVNILIIQCIEHGMHELTCQDCLYHDAVIKVVMSGVSTETAVSFTC